jgi:hypothetical protein
MKGFDGWRAALCARRDSMKAYAARYVLDGDDIIDSALSGGTRASVLLDVIVREICAIEQQDAEALAAQSAGPVTINGKPLIKDGKPVMAGDLVAGEFIADFDL